MQPRLTPAELACGIQFGLDQLTYRELGRRHVVAAPRPASEALIGVIEQSLPSRSYVLFSGGLDSSLVLGAATEAARRAGRAAPVPVTLRHPDHPHTEESSYQDAVIRHLGLTDWLVLSVDDELDVLGETSRRELRQHGMSVFARVPAMAWVLEQLPEPGLVLSGEGGDQVLGGAPLAPLHFARAALRGRRYRKAAFRQLAGWPKAAHSRRLQVPAPWLTAEGKRQALPNLHQLMRGRGWTMKSSLRHHRSKRFVVNLLAELEQQAARHKMSYMAPLLDLGFIAELTATVPDRQFMNRNITLRHHFGGLVPQEIERRTSKAEFRSTVNGPPTIDFAGRWRGEGVPLDLVDPEILRRVWMEGSDARSWLLLQHAWLECEGRG